MSTFKINITKKGLRRDNVALKVAPQLAKLFGDEEAEVRLAKLLASIFDLPEAAPDATVNNSAENDAKAVVIKKLVADLLPGASCSVSVYDPPESRSERLAEIKSDASDIRSTAEELRDELQDWLDNMPEGLQGGDKAGEIEEAISSLESEVIEHLEEVENSDVSFPSMF